MTHKIQSMAMMEEMRAAAHRGLYARYDTREDMWEVGFVGVGDYGEDEYGWDHKYGDAVERPSLEDAVFAMYLKWKREE